MSEADAEKLTALLFVVLAAIGGLLLVRSLFRRVRADEGERPSRVVPAVGPDGTDAPRCVCTAIATDPAPVIARGRGTFVRGLLAIPPRYWRETGKGDSREFCQAHTHTADAMIDEFLATDVRAIFQRAYAEAAAKIAAFETEGLRARVAESLTEAQKGAAKRAARGTTAAPSVRLLPRTGTTDDGGEGSGS